MAYINLLPWREEALKVKQKEFFTLLIAVALLAFALIFVVNLYFQARVDGQLTRNQFLKNEIQQLEIQIAEIRTLNDKKAALKKRIEVIEQLQRSRNVGTQILDEIAKIIPNGIYITQLDKQGNSIEIIGKSESNNHLANMIRAIELSDLFTDATPESITSDDDSSKLLSSFKMRVKIQGLVNDATLANQAGGNQ
ncbi:PilN domain-containing protein [Colwellia sp. 4_MG-2023]|jgi:type IV pilus assembly protein PilN|uniref:PilN domain-containing protein n=1 Tax=unclassified Colwellia TaxID=196834 RepID=UPI001C09E5B8|nr:MULTISPECIES: PilN domain-containing protein [unclassified Colwellia]MBU2925136.1 PilN domain-containing protein [Colwellia sp. C2M11]MDO6507276.1 PilN domain-containing protein [Colwellia sp. 5_MG-2023]MDO6555380.1 PilN domain-containing protein [Colwellia sp. 4_MG-2023]MDO6653367.1 PilN domain-containing protein [Colwellia sp. 3_MG-2023]MDO6666151.1 PilN domain-containing protein [Colwellia sp. 2_MG-2023]